MIPLILVFIIWTVTSAIFQETGNKAAGRATIAMIVRPLTSLNDSYA